MAARKRYVIGNWKTHPNTLSESRKIFKGLVKGLPRTNRTEVGICPPDVFLTPLKLDYRGSKVLFGAQNSAKHPKGSHTGETLPSMLKGLGITYVILGHSERRKDGETSEEVAEKIQIALKSGLTPVICFGESERDAHGKYLTVLRDQLKTTLKGVSKGQLAKCILAYEPVWAIGKSADEALDAEGLHQTVLYIRKVLVELYDRGAGMRARLLYGGSVEPGNAPDLITDVDGYLVGHASLVPEEFIAIIKSAEQGA